jgi:asparagine synthase (glutamine-hydrolysing)
MARAEREYGYPRKQALIEMAFYLLPDGPRQAIQRARFGHLLTPAWLETSRLEAGLRLNEVLPPTHTVEDGACTQTLYSSLPALLHWEDRNSMAHSIESRVPFLDYRLAEFVMGLPTDYKLRDCRTKMVLRDGLEGILPERIRERRDKVGFATAEAEWIRSEPELFRGLAREAIVGSFGILNGEAGRLFEEVASGVRDHDRDRFVWRWICFARWLRVFGVRP